MSPTAGTHRMSIDVGRSLVDDIVITRRTHASWQVVQVEPMTNLPSDDVIRAGSVSAHANRSEQRAVLAVKGEPAPKHVHPTAFLARQRVIRFSVVFGRSLI